MRKIMGLLTVLGTICACKGSSQGFLSLGVEEYAKEIEDAEVVRVDVRTAEEYARGHIEGAINIDVQKEDFVAVAKAVLPKNHTIALNCRSGRRSKKAAGILSEAGYKVIELENGYDGWVEAGKMVTKEEVDLFLTPGGACVYLYCIKHGTLRARIGDKWLYLDPVSDKIPPVTDYSAMPKADAILITHEHMDHLDLKAVSQLRKEGTLVLANPSSAVQISGAVPMRNGEVNSGIESWTIEAVPAYNNSPDKQQFHPKGRDNGYVLTVDGFRIYFAGDTEDIPEMEARKGVDVCFLPCNLPFTMTPEQLSSAARMISPKVLFPYHFGSTEIQRVVDLLSDTKIDVRIRQYQ